jgi:hypothetical protein
VPLSHRDLLLLLETDDGGSAFLQTRLRSVTFKINMKCHVFIAVRNQTVFFLVVALQSDSCLTSDVQVMDVYILLTRAVLLMFRRYMLSLSPGSKYVGGASFIHYLC